MTSKSSIVVLGSSNTDMTVKMQRLPKPGETVIGGAFSIAGGGKGANQAVAVARAGGHVTFVARLGTDLLGDQAIESLRMDGIATHRIARESEVASGVALIFVDEKGENCIAVAAGANGRLSLRDVKEARTEIESARVFLTQLEVPVNVVQSAIEIAWGAGATVILNPAPAQRLDESIYRSITIITPNEVETEMLTGISVENDAEAAKAADKFHSWGVQTVIITRGQLGAYLSSPGNREMIPGFRVNPVDTTAAGDVFNGALAVVLAEGADLPTSIRFAHAAAAISVTRMGAQSSIPRRDEIEAFMSNVIVTSKHVQ